MTPPIFMAFSKSTRIIILLVIDTMFFLLELSVGYAVHSLALIADAFHMLKNVLSLCVGLWAVKVFNSRPSSNTYTYGWQRAQTLGALVNGVFLVALCVSIFLEAIQRLVEPQVSQPKLVLIVGSLGLASNIAGLFLFHEHGHGHGHGDEIADAEEGHTHSPDHDHAKHANREQQSTARLSDTTDVDEYTSLAEIPIVSTIALAPDTLASMTSTLSRALSASPLSPPVA